jgi:hypothetical protein
MVIDHGSNDGTLAVARQFESNEVRVATQPNHEAVGARVPSAGDTANPDELKDDLEKYEHLEELAERFFAAKRRHLRHQAKNPADLTRTIRTYFASDLYQNLETRRSEIREFANERSSWIRVGEILMAFIDGCLRNKRAEQKKLLAMQLI